jgi:ApeA N-terminal domain 1
MFKPSIRIGIPLFPYNEVQWNSIQVLFEKYLNNWFKLSKTPLINLYCAVMYNPEMYMEYLFLGLAQAIESYHATFLETESIARAELRREIEEIGDTLPEKVKWLDQIFKDCYRQPFIERIRDVYQEYSALADQLFAFKGEEKFSKKVRDTRHYLTHWSADLVKKAAHDDDLVLLTRDLQFLLQLCIMTQLGFTKCDFTNMYHVNKV